MHDSATEKHKSLDGKCATNPRFIKGTKAADHKSFSSTSETKMISRVRTSQFDVQNRSLKSDIDGCTVCYKERLGC